MQIEFLAAWEDGTWTTELVDVPDSLDRNSYEELRLWAERELAGQCQYRRVVLFAVYHINPEEMPEEVSDHAQGPD